MAPSTALPDPPAVEDRDRRATWLELFFDLVFAAAVADAGNAFAADYSAAGLLRFGFLFLLIWWAWVGHTLFATRFDSDDAVQRLSTLGQVFLVAVMAVNTETDLASREAAGFAAAYAGMRVLLAGQYLRVIARPATRAFVLRHAAGIGAGSIVWLVSAVVPPPARYPLWGVALAIDLLTPLVALRVERVPPADPAHLPERFGLFTLIFLGESVIAVMAGMRHQDLWTAAAGGSAALGMALTFAVWWGYFDVLAAAAPRFATTRDAVARMRWWAAAHLPLCFGIAVGAGGLERVIHLGGIRPLGGAGGSLLAGAVGLTVLALGLIAAATPAGGRRLTTAGKTLRRHGGVALATLLVAIPAAKVSPVWVLGLLTALVVVAVLGEARSRRPATVRSGP